MPNMEMRQSQRLEQKQKLVLTQKIQQSLEMLQLPSLELEKLIRQELEENPLLETGQDEGQTEAGPDAEDEAGGVEEEPERDESEEDDPLDILKRIEENEGYGSGGGGGSYSDDEEPWRPEPVKEPTLYEHLLEQVYNRRLSPGMEGAAIYVVYSLDRHGLLSLSDDELEAGWDGDPGLLWKAVDLVQDLEPVGIGSRSASDALLAQLEAEGMDPESLEYRMVRDHFEDMVERRLPAIARAEGVTPHRVQEALDSISHLDPWPGSDFAGSSNSVVIPDIIIREIDGELRAFLNDTRFPTLHISARNRRILESPNTPEKEKEYVKNKFKRASWFIKAIAQRQETMQKIGTFLADYQEDFFRHGISGLRPLTLQQVADALDYNQSTISRAINGKYIQSPRGVHEMRFLFSRGLGEGSAQMSTRTVKEELRKLIASEDKRKPYSDARLAEMLQARGMDVKRRTVANYRNDLGIESARRRRVY